MKYGADYYTPCEKYVVDILNDGATKYDAYSFFNSSDAIQMDMMSMLNNTLTYNCSSTL